MTNMSQANSTEMQGMTLNTLLDDCLAYWNQNPWWILGLVQVGLAVLAILGGAAFGIVTLIRQSRASWSKGVI